MPTPQMLCPGIARLRARRVSNNQIPSPPPFMRYAIHSREGAVPIEQRQAIALYVPLWMPAAALLNVARESIMPTRTKRLAYFLAFFTSHQYVYNVTSFSFIQPHKISRAKSPCKLLGKMFSADNVQLSVRFLLLPVRSASFHRCLFC